MTENLDLCIEHENNEWQDGIAGYEAENREALLRLEEVRNAYGRRLDEYERTVEAVYRAEKLAKDTEHSLHLAAEEEQMLAAEEADRRSTAAMTVALMQDAVNSSAVYDSSCNGLMGKALEALKAVSFRAEEDLSAKKEACAKAASRRQKLELSSLAAQLAYTLSRICRYRSAEQLADASHRRNLLELEAKVAENRAEISSYMADIALRRQQLDAAALELEQAERQLAAMNEQEQQQAALLASLQQQIEESGSDLLPCQEQILELERSLENAKADHADVCAGMRQLEQRRSILEDDLNAAMETGTEQVRLAEKALREWEDSNQNQVWDLEKEIARKTEKREQVSHELMELEQHIAEIEGDIRTSRNVMEELSATVERVKATATSTRRLLDNTQNMQRTFSGGDSDTLTKAVAMLRNAQDEANRLLMEKELACQQEQQRMQELQQQESEAHRNHGQKIRALQEMKEELQAMEAAYDENMSAYTVTANELRTKISNAQSELQRHTNPLLRELEQIGNSLQMQEKRRDELAAFMNEVEEQLQVVRDARNTVQQKIRRLNQEVIIRTEEETCGKEKQRIAVVEQIETLRMRIREEHEAVKGDIIAVNRIAALEQEAVDSLSVLAEEYDARMYELREKTLSLLGSLYADRLALDECVSRARLGRGEEPADPAETAAMHIIDRAERMEDSLALSDSNTVYELKYRQPLSLDMQLLMLPVPTVDGGFYEPKWQNLAVGRDAVHGRVLAQLREENLLAQQEEKAREERYRRNAEEAGAESVTAQAKPIVEEIAAGGASETTDVSLSGTENAVPLPDAAEDETAVLKEAAREAGPEEVAADEVAADEGLAAAEEAIVPEALEESVIPEEESILPEEEIIPDEAEPELEPETAFGSEAAFEEAAAPEVEETFTVEEAPLLAEEDGENLLAGIKDVIGGEADLSSLDEDGMTIAAEADVLAAGECVIPEEEGLIPEEEGVIPDEAELKETSIFPDAEAEAEEAAILASIRPRLDTTDDGVAEVVLEDAESMSPQDMAARVAAFRLASEGEPEEPLCFGDGADDMWTAGAADTELQLGRLAAEIEAMRSHLQNISADFGPLGETGGLEEAEAKRLADLAANAANRFIADEPGFAAKGFSFTADEEDELENELQRLLFSGFDM